MSAPSGDLRLSPQNETYASWHGAFLCDDEGRVLRDFAELLPNSSESISAESLISLAEFENFLSFLKTVRSSDAGAITEMSSHYPGYPIGLLLKGSQIPGGILIFAILTLESAALKQNQSVSSASVTDGLPKNDLTHSQSNAAATLGAIMKREVSTLESLSLATHDLKNSISSIISSCEYMTEYSRENLHPEQLALIVGIESSAKALLQISGRLSLLCTQKSQLFVSVPGAGAKKKKVRRANETRRASS